MRVLMLSYLYPNRANPMAGVFVQEQVAALRELGVEVTLVAPVPYAPKILHKNPRYQALAQVPFEEREGSASAYHPRMLLFPRQFLFSYSGQFYERSVRNALQRLGITNPKEAFDVIHAHVALPDGEAARRLSQDFNIPYVVTIHGQDFYDTLKRSPKERGIVAQVLAESAKVVMVSSKLREIAEQNELPGLNHTEIVPNGVNLSKIYSGVSPLASPFKGKTVLLSVGNLIPRKAHAYVLRALKKLIANHPTLHYVIVGDGQERAALESLTQELDLEDSVTFVGRVEHAKALEYMSLCDIFVLPSWAEAFGVVYIEAMAHGKPVLGCLGEGVEDIVEEDVTGKLVPAKDVDALVRGISSLMDSNKRQKMGQQGQKVVKERFTWLANARRMREVYHEIEVE